jgi:phosphomethylpyrimidine synthase
MKITQEVRDFAAKQNSDSYLATENIKRETSPAEAEEAREGMEKMSEKYEEVGRQLYIGAGDREHD